MNPRQVTLGFTVFRPETLPFARTAMRDSDVVILEEPETPGFDAMLAGELPPEEYVLLSEFEFPEYARGQCDLLQELHNAGKKVLQIHPWLDKLIEIHEFFAAGHGPEELPKYGYLPDVYNRERQWTAALIDFYESSGTGSFARTIETVTAFAREDARKIRSMDEARAKTISDAVSETGEGTRIYVECGSIHFDMVMLLRKRIEGSTLKVRHLMEEVCKPRFGSRRLLPPGDILTFRHLMAAPENPFSEKLLAARAVLYNRLIQKGELIAPSGNYPHMENEALVISLVNTLDFEQCERIYFEIGQLSPEKALEHIRKTGQ